MNGVREWLRKAESIHSDYDPAALQQSYASLDVDLIKDRHQALLKALEAGIAFDLKLPEIAKLREVNLSTVQDARSLKPLPAHRSLRAAHHRRYITGGERSNTKVTHDSNPR